MSALRPTAACPQPHHSVGGLDDRRRVVVLDDRPLVRELAELDVLAALDALFGTFPQKGVLIELEWILVR